MGGVELGAGAGVVDAVGGKVARGLDGRLGVRLGVALVALEQGIALQLGVHEGVELKIRQLQQLDRLLQLRRDDQTLALPYLKSRAERQNSPLACFLLATLRGRKPPIG